MDASAAAAPGNVVRIGVRANLRQGAPSIAAPIAGKLDPGTALQVAAVVPGDPVLGDATWYRIGAGDYVWSGACGPFEGPVPGPPVSPGAPSVPPVVDIYDGDRVASFAVARNAGVLGIIHKATTGATGTDDAYAGRRQQALEAGLLWGAYHWGTAAPVAQQVDNFLNLARPDAQTLVALDFESDVGDQMTLQGARDFLTQIESRLGRRAVLYSGATIRAALGETRDPFFGGHRLWLPQYALAPVVPPSWDTYWLWQYTDGTAGPGPRQAPGIPGNARGQLDCNRFDGSADQLAAQWAS